MQQGTDRFIAWYERWWAWTLFSLIAAELTYLLCTL